MRLTWEDGVATAVMALILGVYLLYTSGADIVFVSSVRGSTAAILLLGAIGCGYGAADQLYKAAKSTATRVFMVVASTLGATALVTGFIALVLGSEIALTVLFAATAGLWLLATARHLAGTCRAPRVTGEITEPRKEAKAQ